MRGARMRMDLYLCRIDFVLTIPKAPVLVFIWSRE
jgi:hypothetical protein